MQVVLWLPFVVTYSIWMIWKIRNTIWFQFALLSIKLKVILSWQVMLLRSLHIMM